MKAVFYKKKKKINLAMFCFHKFSLLTSLATLLGRCAPHPFPDITIKSSRRIPSLKGRQKGKLGKYSKNNIGIMQSRYEQLTAKMEDNCLNW